MKFKIDETEYSVPEVITIESYSKVFKVKDLFTEEYFTAKLVSLVTDCPLEKLLESDYDQINYIAAFILDMFPKDKPKFIDKFTLDGIEYGFFPRWQDLTYAEFVDMDTISTKKEDELLNMLHILCAVMYRPIVERRSEHDFDIEKYDVKTMVKRAEIFKKKLDVRYVLGAQSFFMIFGSRYSIYSQLSLIPNMTKWTKIKLTWKMRKLIWKQIFNRPLDGSLSQTEYLQMILQNTTTSTKKP
jgi:hypothetical protein